MLKPNDIILVQVTVLKMIILEPWTGLDESTVTLSTVLADRDGEDV